MPLLNLITHPCTCFTIQLSTVICCLLLSKLYFFFSNQNFFFSFSNFDFYFVTYSFNILEFNTLLKNFLNHTLNLLLLFGKYHNTLFINIVYFSHCLNVILFFFVYNISVGQFQLLLQVVSSSFNFISTSNFIHKFFYYFQNPNFGILNRTFNL